MKETKFCKNVAMYRKDNVKVNRSKRNFEKVKKTIECNGRRDEVQKDKKM